MFVKFGIIDLSETIMKHAVWISDICVSEIRLLGKIMEMYKSWLIHHENKSSPIYLITTYRIYKQNICNIIKSNSYIYIYIYPRFCPTVSISYIFRNYLVPCECSGRVPCSVVNDAGGAHMRCLWPPVPKQQPGEAILRRFAHFLVPAPRQEVLQVSLFRFCISKH